VRLPFSSTRNCFLVRLCTGLSFVSMVLAVYLGPARSARRIRRWQRVWLSNGDETPLRALWICL
jgi:hypothetical protein